MTAITANPSSTARLKEILPLPSSASGTSATASTAFLRMLVITWLSSLMSKAATIFSDSPAPPSAAPVWAENAKSMSGCATRIMNRFCLAISVRSFGAMAGFGIRAKAENSSTMRLISSTCRTIVAVHWSNTSLSAVMTFPYLRRIRSAESWIGVSGFLISWAMRRATSPQAELRCAWTRSVMSSSVTTEPREAPAPARS